VRAALRLVFGARGQLAVGAATFCGAVGAWWYGAGLRGEPLVRFIFHASMAALALAAYAIVATALGFRATERVEERVAGDGE
jgi:ABC-type branched-subunit amino acid transport system permease subunit